MGMVGLELRRVLDDDQTLACGDQPQQSGEQRGLPVPVPSETR
jgi:hypothetical protein